MERAETFMEPTETFPYLMARLSHWFSSVQRVGVAVHYIPHYVRTSLLLHTLDVVLISFTVRGRATHFLDDMEYEETPGSISITHYGQAHCVVTDEEGIANFNVYLDLRNHPLPILPVALRDVLAAILPLHPDLCHRQNRRVQLHLKNKQSTVDLLERIIDEQNLQDEASDEVIRSLLGIFFVQLCRAALRHGLVTPPSAKGKSTAWLEQLRQNLDTHYREPQTLTELSRKAGMHPNYLCNAFKLHTGVTLMEYLNMRRIQAAMIQLRSTQDKIIQIALECGFNDLAYFNRKFRAVTGKTPTQYRAEIKPT
ncbi:MAG: AraC family transcriptional regulator [Chthoniobacteraceae bacterium]